jgi:nitrogen fixation NifU-like protein
MLYTDIVMDHFSNPRNVGEIKDADGVGEVGNIQCGDIMKIYIKVENDVITDCKFKTFGCGSAIASSSVTTEMVIGKTIDEALELTNKDVVQQLGGLPSVKVHCSVLAEDALKVAIYNYAEKTGKEYKGLEGFEPSQLSHEH